MLRYTAVTEREGGGARERERERKRLRVRERERERERLIEEGKHREAPGHCPGAL
jgi:hypothetical protein